RPQQKPACRPKVRRPAPPARLLPRLVRLLAPRPARLRRVAPLERARLLARRSNTPANCRPFARAENGKTESSLRLAPHVGFTRLAALDKCETRPSPSFDAIHRFSREDGYLDRPGITPMDDQ